jgi:hypothetical protein
VLEGLVEQQIHGSHADPCRRQSSQIWPSQEPRLLVARRRVSSFAT